MWTAPGGHLLGKKKRKLYHDEADEGRVGLGLGEGSEREGGMGEEE